MKTTFRMRLQLLISAAAVTAAPAFAAYTATPFEIPGSSATTLWDITNNGQMVGNSDLGAFIYSGGVASYLPSFNGQVPGALGLSDGGVVVGSFFDAVNETTTGFVYDGGAYALLTIPGATDTQVRHISADGRYAAGYYAGDTVGGGFVLDRNTSVLTLVPVDPTQTFMILQGANSAGLVTGSLTGPAGGGVIYNAITGTTSVYASSGALTRLRFRDITEAGLIAGYAGAFGIVGTVSGGFETFSVAGATGTYGEGINEAGVVVGNYNDADGNVRAFIASVPEPTSALLLAAGLGWVAMRRRALR